MSDQFARQQGVHHPPPTFSQGPIYYNFQTPHDGSQPFIEDYASTARQQYNGAVTLQASNGHEGSNANQYHRPTPEGSFHSQGPSPHLSSRSIASPSGHISSHSPLPVTNNQDRALQRPPIVHADLLLSLAEEYLAVAYQLSTSSDDSSGDSISREYYRLVATALGCIETVLARCRLQPAQEAAVRLRYATILFEETDNEMEAEEALSKGIALADRHKLFALKYNMQHLLVRVLFVTRAPAAFKYLNGIIKDAEAYQHSSWVYSLNFLKLSLHLKVSRTSRQEVNLAFSTLTRVNELAEHRGDLAVVALTVVMKGWLCLKASNSQESFEEAQTLLASARALQDKPEVKSTPQITIMIAFVDLCCYLQRMDPVQANEKLKHVHEVLGLILKAENWLADGSFKISISRDSTIMPGRNDGIVRAGEGNSVLLMLNWYPKDDIYTVGYLLSGITMKCQSKPQKDAPEQMLKQGINKGSYDQEQSDKLSQPIISRGALQLWRQHLNAYMRLYLAFMQCMRSSWERGFKQLKEFRAISRSWPIVPPSLKAISDLLEATYCQGTGSLPRALNIYQDLLDLRTKEVTSLDHMMGDVCRIAALNSMMILRNSQHDGHQSAMALFSNLGRDCPDHPNRQIQAAYNLVNSTLSQSMTIIARKQTLQLALNAAKFSHSNTSLCISLSLMHWYFFRDQVTDQAEKSARAAQNMANRVENNLWMSTTAGILGDHLEAAGRSTEAAATLLDGWKAAEGLPSQVKLQLGWVHDDDPAGQ